MASKKRRDRLFAEHPYCEKCNVELVHPKSCYEKVTRPDGKILARMITPVPNNMATIEHDHSRYNLDRWAHKKGQICTRLLCARCNETNAIVEWNALPADIRTRISQINADSNPEKRQRVRMVLMEAQSAVLLDS